MKSFKEYVNEINKVDESIIGTMRKIRDTFAKSPSYSFATLVDAKIIDKNESIKNIKIKYFEKDFNENKVYIKSEDEKILDTYPLKDVLKAIKPYYAIESDDAQSREEAIKETKRILNNKLFFIEFANKNKNKTITTKRKSRLYALDNYNDYMEISSDTDLKLIKIESESWHDGDFIVEYKNNTFRISPYDIYIKGIK